MKGNPDFKDGKKDFRDKAWLLFCFKSVFLCFSHIHLSKGKLFIYFNERNEILRNKIFSGSVEL